MDRFDPFVKYADVYGDIINWEKDPMNKPQNQNKYFFSDGKTYYEQICKMLRLMSVFKEAFNQIYSNEDEISEAWENFVNNLSASVVEGSEPDVTLTWTDDSVNFEFTMVPGVPGEQGVGITSISFNSDYTMTITLSDGNTYTSMSLKGETGPQGPQGETGSGLQILDVYATLADLQSAHPTGQPGDAYQVGSAGNYTLYIWSSSQSAWIPAGSLGTVSPSTSNPLMDGTASAGSSNLYSRGDHVHPTDTSRASKEELDELIKTSQALIDQSFTYRESPAIQDGLARIDKIKGNTIVWNQLMQNGNFANIGSWQTPSDYGSISAENNVLKYTALQIYNGAWYNRVYCPLTKEVISGHKLLIKIDIDAPKNCNLTVVINNSTGQSFNQTATITTSQKHYYVIGNVTAPGGNSFASIFNLSANYSAGDIVNISNVQIFDLTLMDMASLTYQYFESLFFLPYYEYNAGSLLSFNGTGLKTVGKNLFNQEWESGSIDSSTGEPVENAYIDRFKDYIRVFPNTRYYYWYEDIGNNMPIYYYGGNKNYLGRIIAYSGNAFVTPSDCYFIRGAIANGQGLPQTLIQKDTTDREYEDYNSYTLDLPISTYFPTGMKSARSVYDEMTATKAINRIGAVDLGSLDYFYTQSTNSMSVRIDSLKKTASNSVPANILTTIGKTIPADDRSTATGERIYSFVDDNVVYFRDIGYTDPTSFKNAMSGVYLYYELATPEETAISPELDLSFKSYLDGTEQLLPVNGSVPSTSPVIANMTYLSIDDAMEYIIDKLANVPENTQQILDSLEDDVADLQTDVGALQPAVSSLQTSVGNINTNIGQLSSTVAGHTASISDMQSDITDLDNSITSLEGTVTNNTSRIGTLETGLSTTNGNVQNLSTSVSGLDSTVTAQGKTVTALDNFVSNIANTSNPGYMSSDNSIGITTAFLNMTLAAGQSTWANIPLPTIMAGFIPLFVVGASTGDGSVCLFKIPSTYNQNNIYKVGVKNTSNSEVTTQVGIEILCIKQRQSQ